MGRYAVAHLDDIEAIPGPASLTWRPVRAHFGLHAFGTNAYAADQPGEDVVEPHSAKRPDLAGLAREDVDLAPLMDPA